MAGGVPATGYNVQTFIGYAMKALGGPFLVAEEGDRIIGFTLGIASGDPVDTGAVDLIGFGTWVDPEWRHSGFGRAMRQMFEDAGREDGFTRIMEIIPAENSYTQKVLEMYGYIPIHTVYERRI